MYRRPCLSSLILSSFQREGTVSDTDVLPRGASADSVDAGCRVSRKYWGPTLGGRETLKTLLTGRYSRASSLKQSNYSARGLYRSGGLYHLFNGVDVSIRISK